MASITVRFTPTMDDLIRAGYVAVRARPFIFWTSVSFFVFLPWLLALVGIATADEPADWISILGLLIVPPLMVLLFAVMPVFLTRGAKGLTGEHQYILSEQDIETSGPGFRGRLEWAMLDSYVSSPKLILLMSGKLALLTIPGRALDNGLRVELLSLARSKSLKVIAIS